MNLCATALAVSAVGCMYFVEREVMLRLEGNKDERVW